MIVDDKLLDKLTENANRYHSRINRDLNKVQDKMFKDIERFIVDEVMQIIEETDKRKDGTISPSKGRTIRSKMNEVEIGLRDVYEEGIVGIIEDVSEELYGQLVEQLPETTLKHGEFVSTMTSSVMSKRQDDGLNMNDRVKRNSLLLRQAVETALMYKVLSKADLKEIIQEVRSELRKNKWTVARVIKSEMYATHRMAVMKVVEMMGSDFLILFEDGNCGRPDHHNHDCWNIAQEDRHGLGNAVFKASDKDILYPHVSCTSKLQIIRKDSLQEQEVEEDD